MAMILSVGCDPENRVVVLNDRA
ncbi:hypothetical protein DESC_940081 [Desulfosarcina cetonica]|nr:hypothetical protein DESC_940081 [Desulfosarcina cetonica]